MWVERASCERVAESRNPDKYYVLVTRYYPMAFRKRGLKLKQAVDTWDRSLAPSKELLKEFKANGDWEGYKQRFFEEIPRDHIKNVITQHMKDAKYRPIVLVCEEELRDYPHCHTWLILEMLEKVMVI